MECCRICIITALAVCTAALTCSALFPLFRRVDDGVTNGIYYWYTENSTTADNTVHISRVYTRHLSCSQAKTFFIVSCAASTVGAALGFLAVLLSVAHLHAIRKSCFSVLVAVCAMVACLCSAACVALASVMYATTVCPNTVGQIQYKADSFQIREGFILACVACGGFLIAFVFHLSCRMSGKADA